MTRRNPERYTAEDWKHVGRTVGAILANRWLVYTGCDLCALRAVIPAKAGTRRPAPHPPRAGSSFVLWGRATTCRRMGCPGRVTFWVRPHGASGDVAMT